MNGVFFLNGNVTFHLLFCLLILLCKADLIVVPIIKNFPSMPVVSWEFNNEIFLNSLRFIKVTWNCTSLTLVHPLPND